MFTDRPILTTESPVILQRCSPFYNEDKLALDILIGGQEIRSPSYCSSVMTEVAGLLLVSVESCRVVIKSGRSIHLLSVCAVSPEYSACHNVQVSWRTNTK